MTHTTAHTATLSGMSQDNPTPTARFRRPRRILWFVGREVWSTDRRKTVFSILVQR